MLRLITYAALLFGQRECGAAWPCEDDDWARYMTCHEKAFGWEASEALPELCHERGGHNH